MNYKRKKNYLTLKKNLISNQKREMNTYKQKLENNHKYKQKIIMNTFHK